MSLSPRISIAAALLLTALPVAAQESPTGAGLPAATAEPVPPGDGMIEQPCPAQTGLWFGAPYVKQYDWAWLCRYRAENAELAKEGAPGVVFMGDSITESWARLDPQFFAKSGPNAGGRRNLGRGISGQTSQQMLLRFWQDVIALHPRVVHIMAGTNDIAGNTGPTDAESYKNNIRAMVDLAQANGIAVILGSIPPADRFDWKPQMKPSMRIVELNAWLKDYARRGALVYADYYSVLAAGDGALNPAYTSDGVHPEAAGYAAMRPVAQRAIAAAAAR